MCSCSVNQMITGRSCDPYTVVLGFLWQQALWIYHLSASIPESTEGFIHLNSRVHRMEVQRFN